jgi:hypothetical protein
VAVRDAGGAAWTSVLHNVRALSTRRSSAEALDRVFGDLDLLQEALQNDRTRSRVV